MTRLEQRPAPANWLAPDANRPHQPHHTTMQNLANPHKPTALRSPAPNGFCEAIAPTRPTLHRLTLVLAGITADDYLQWVRDPDPPVGTEVSLLSAQAAPLGDRIEIELLVHHASLNPQTAAEVAGFPITPEVIEIHSA